MRTHQVQWIHGRDALVVITHCAVQVIDPQHLPRLDVIEGDPVGLDVSFPADFFVKNHEGSK